MYTTIKPTPANIIIKISNDDRKGDAERKFIRDDGSEGMIITKTDLRVFKDDEDSQFLRPLDDSDNDRSQVFVRLGAVVAVGADVKGISEGDGVILDYLTDNDPEIIIDYDGLDKIISIKAETLYYPKDEVAHANRERPQNFKDQIVAFKGEIKELSPVIAVIKFGAIQARHPYVIISHGKTEGEASTKSGIVFNQKERIIRRKVISTPVLPADSEIGFSDGDDVMVEEKDCFDIVIRDSMITSCFWYDVMAKC